MSASLNTFIELEGTLKEIKAMIAAIKGYCSCNQDVSLDSPRIHHKKKFDGENHDYIYECYCSYSFPNMNFIDFKYSFPNAKIEEEEFNRNVATAIEKFGLVSFETFCK